MRIDGTKRLMLISVAIPLFFYGCSSQELKSVKNGSPDLPVTVENIISVRTSGESGGAEILLVPKSAIVRKGELTGILVVGADDRLILRWIRTGRLLKDDLVVLGGLDKGEFVVGTYNPAFNEGVTVKKGPRVTEEVQSK